MKKNSITPPLEKSGPIHLLDFSNYKKPHPAKSGWQIINTIVPYLGLWALMIYLIRQEVPYWVILLLSVVAGGFLVRLFIIFHDCCHRSFFVSTKLNMVVGYILGVLTFTPYEEWRYLHLKHHGTAGNLDRRGTGDIWTMTVAEYLASTRKQKFLYRIVRNPLLMLGFGPIFYFLIAQRFWHKGAPAQQKYSVLLTNVILLLILGGSYFTMGISTYVAIQLPTIIVAGAIGIWMFYVQHQFEGVYWARQEHWNPTKAALEGSSFYKLPKVLQWITGNIGYHHIHHIRPQIPNYNLQKCFNEITEFQSVNFLTLRKSLSSLFLNLWNEQQSKLISFRKLKTLNRQVSGTQ